MAATTIPNSPETVVGTESHPGTTPADSPIVRTGSLPPALGPLPAQLLTESIVASTEANVHAAAAVEEDSHPPRKRVRHSSSSRSAGPPSPPATAVNRPAHKSQAPSLSTAPSSHAPSSRAPSSHTPSSRTPSSRAPLSRAPSTTPSQPGSSSSKHKAAEAVSNTDSDPHLAIMVRPGDYEPLFPPEDVNSAWVDLVSAVEIVNYRQ